MTLAAPAVQRKSGSAKVGEKSGRPKLGNQKWETKTIARVHERDKPEKTFTGTERELLLAAMCAMSQKRIAAWKM